MDRIYAVKIGSVLKDLQTLYKERKKKNNKKKNKKKTKKHTPQNLLVYQQ